VFQNRRQALAEPAWYVHLRLWSYPIALFTEDSVTFFIEQASAAYAQPPYRQRVLRLRSQAGDLTAEYYALKQPEAYRGATQAPERLAALTEEQLQSLQGSRLPVTVSPEGAMTRFVARQYPGERCQFSINGELKQVELGFDAIVPQPGSAEPAAFWMYDQGINPNTAEPTWGALKGPFQLLKIEDWSFAIPNSGSS
jgi:hypothetical protein